MDDFKHWLQSDPNRTRKEPNQTRHDISKIRTGLMNITPKNRKFESTEPKRTGSEHPCLVNDLQIFKKVKGFDTFICFTLHFVIFIGFWAFGPKYFSTGSAANAG